MTLWILAVLTGLAGLVWASERFVFGAAAIASNLGVSPLVVGLTVVGIGTSAPELLVSALAATDGNPGLAVGNVVGSNIANVGLVLGAAALVAPIDVASTTLRREFPLMLAVVAGAWWILRDGYLGRVEGAALLGAVVVVLIVLMRIAGRARGTDPLVTEFESEVPRNEAMGTAVAWALVGLVLLLASSRAVVWGASEIAAALGVSDLVIGLTIVAVGTSLPELATAVASVVKGEPDMAVGNVIGSNMFNLLPVLAMPGLIAPGPLPGDVLMRDYPVMVGMTAALFVVAYGFRGRGRVQRWEGALLLCAFLAYQVMLYLSAAGT